MTTADTDILHVLATPRAEGTPNLVLDWLTTGSCRQSIFVLHDQPADLTVKLREQAQTYEESHGLLSGWRQFPRIAWKTWQVCRSLKPDLLICWPAGLAVWICLGARLAGVKKLIVHSGNPPNLGLRGEWLTRYVMWPVWLMSARVVCCSVYVKGELAKIPFVPTSMMHAVPNCARAASIAERAGTARVRREKGKGIIAVMVATLEAHKDHETLLKAMPQVLAACPGFRLLLAGEGSFRQPLMAKAQELGLQGHVEFLGARKDVPELLGQADLFVFSTTLQEGLGSVLLEALAAGLPIVASDVPACREILEAGRWGNLVKAGDSNALAEAMIETAAFLPDEPESLRVSRSQHALRFTPEAMMKQYLSLF